MQSSQIDMYVFKLFTHFCHWLALLYNLRFFTDKVWDAKAIKIVIRRVGCKGC